MTAPTSIGVVAHYNLLERLEPSGPGELYRARDTHRGRTVVVRVLPESGDLEAQGALLAEARALARLSHQNAITVYEAGEHQAGIYVAFEHVNGRSLRAEMAGRAMNARRAVEIAIEITDAVAEAHALGFAPNGISPESIAINAKGHAKIPAFHLGTTLGFTGSGAEAVLADYLSPEEARGDAPDERSDVYSIGAVLYEALTGRKPQHRGVSAPSDHNPRVPAALDVVVLKAAAPNTERRYTSAAELAASLRQVVGQLELPDVPADLARGGGRSGSGPAVVWALVVLTMLAALAWWFTRS